MQKKTFLVYLVEWTLGVIFPLIADEWKYEKNAQYIVLSVLILFFLVVGGGILIFNL